MRYGRINERNTGNHRLDGGAKRQKQVLSTNFVSPDTPEGECYDFIVYALGTIGKTTIDCQSTPLYQEMLDQWEKNGIASSEIEVTHWKPNGKKVFRINQAAKGDLELVRDLLLWSMTNASNRPVFSGIN